MFRCLSPICRKATKTWGPTRLSLVWNATPSHKTAVRESASPICLQAHRPAFSSASNVTSHRSVKPSPSASKVRTAHCCPTTQRALADKCVTPMVSTHALRARRVWPLCRATRASACARGCLRPATSTPTTVRPGIASYPGTRRVMPSARSVGKPAHVAKGRLAVAPPVSAKWATFAFSLPMPRTRPVNQYVGDPTKAPSVRVPQDWCVLALRHRAACLFANNGRQTIEWSCLPDSIRISAILKTSRQIFDSRSDSR